MPLWAREPERLKPKPRPSVRSCLLLSDAAMRSVCASRVAASCLVVALAISSPIATSRASPSKPPVEQLSSRSLGYAIVAHRYPHFLAASGTSASPVSSGDGGWMNVWSIQLKGCSR